MGNVTRQDVQQVVDNARNAILQRTVNRQDIQSMHDILTTRINSCANDLHQQDRQILRQANYQTAQLIRRTIALETRIVALDQEIKSLRQVILRLADQRPPVVMPAQPQPDNGMNSSQQYLYRPS
jgi:Mg2+ and Co2+ transporter CorA